jgi:hypothetical protein
MRSKLLLILVLGMFLVGSFGVVSATPSVPLEGKDFVIRNQSDSLFSKDLNINKKFICIN